jgi:hypothetical protein
MFRTQMSSCFWGVWICVGLLVVPCCQHMNQHAMFRPKCYTDVTRSAGPRKWNGGAPRETIRIQLYYLKINFRYLLNKTYLTYEDRLVFKYAGMDFLQQQKNKWTSVVGRHLPWWWRQRQSPKRWVVSPYLHGWSLSKTAWRSVTVKASSLVI